MSVDRPPLDEAAVHEAVAASLDGLLRLLTLAPTGEDRFRAGGGDGGMADRIYGGQLLAVALLAAGATTEAMAAQSLHVAFVRPGAPGEPVEATVGRTRAGRTTATREVRVEQGGETLLVGVATFRACQGDEVAVHDDVPAVAPPEAMPLLQQWADDMPDGVRAQGRFWIDRPPPVELRLPERLAFLGGRSARTPRSHWMRLPRRVDDDPLLHAALLAYASDFFLMDMVFRAHPDELGPGTANGFSVDHAIWFHRPPRFDTWHLHTQETLAVTGDRGLARGSISDDAGRLVATVMQEVVVRPPSRR